ncbi:MAG: response regulator [Myxococcales bacterium]|jgi:two-component system, OmpR family, response regulator|nr:response regulator [Myxococcales bacterium]
MILVVEPDPATQTALLNTLAGEGHTAVAVSNGTEALNAAKQDPPYVVLLSLNLPDVDGPLLRERLRAVPGCATTPVLFLVKKYDVESSTFGLPMGDDFVMKPLRMAELLLRVNALLLR